MRGKKEEIPEIRHSLAHSRARLTTRNGEPARRLLLKQPAYYFTSFFTSSFPKTDLLFLIAGTQ